MFEDVDLTEHLGLLQNGENVLAVHALNANVSSNDFLMVPRLAALRVGEITSLEHGYIQRPTPGGPNGDVIYAGLVGDIEVDTAHGFHQEPLNVHIASSTPGASIIYTTDGSSPSVDNGIVSPPSGPDTNAAATLRIEETTTVRVAAFKDNLLPSRAETVSYIFVDDIASQDRQSMLDLGYPERWDTRPSDYGVDPNVVGPNDLFDGLYASQFVPSLNSVPTLSIVMDRNHLFDTDTGIYANPTESGDCGNVRHRWS